jgi:hypothetical protein
MIAATDATGATVPGSARHLSNRPDYVISRPTFKTPQQKFNGFTALQGRVQMNNDHNFRTP